MVTKRDLDLRYLQIPSDEDAPYPTNAFPIFDPSAHGGSGGFVLTVPAGVGFVPVNVLAYSEVTSIPVSTETTIVTHTITTENQVGPISGSGSEYARYTLYKNGAKQERRRSGPDNGTVFETSLQVTTGDVVELKVEHFNAAVPGATGDFDGTIYGL